MAGITAGKCGEFMCSLRNCSGAPGRPEAAEKRAERGGWKGPARAENRGPRRNGTANPGVPGGMPQPSLRLSSITLPSLARPPGFISLTAPESPVIAVSVSATDSASAAPSSPVSQ